ncbi:hypothetical protein [Methylosinus sp. PW1]|uniref:hypothetical protein n=1 Tax=Methylosinus sp. PW1 TaxID=107636 RepID=UPI000563FE7C|nr:hypothetical protein [Methylosinus sp. PW1]
MITISDRQHDDHCTLVFCGELWWITGKAGDAISLTSSAGQCILDISAVDWASFDARANVMLRENFPECFHG